MRDPHSRDFKSEDAYGPGWRQARRDELDSDAPPDADDLTRRGRPPSRPARAHAAPLDPDKLASYGYAGQGYPLYGRPHGLDPHPSSEGEPASDARWLLGLSAGAYASGATGFVPPLRLDEPPPPDDETLRDEVRSDSRIREDVCVRLSDDDEVDASNIEVSVRHGEVLLEGAVIDRHDKRRAEDVALSVRGVIDVQNELRVEKTFFQELGDKLVGDDTEHHGHHGSGTRNEPAPHSGF